jgi:V-type H+-transporting ATPase subunit a
MDDMMSGIKVNYIVGTINTVDTDRFRRMIFRVSKGNAWVNLKNIDLQDLGQNYRDPKTVYINIINNKANSNGERCFLNCLSRWYDGCLES